MKYKATGKSNSVSRVHCTGKVPPSTRGPAFHFGKGQEHAHGVAPFEKGHISMTHDLTPTDGERHSMTH